MAQNFWLGRMCYILLIFDPVEATYFPPQTPPMLSMSLT